MKALFSLALLLPALIALGACTTYQAQSSPAVEAKPCPPLVRYSCDFQKRFAAEYRTLAPDSAIKRFADDSATLRQMCGPPPRCGQ